MTGTREGAPGEKVPCSRAVLQPGGTAVTWSSYHAPKAVG